MPSTGRKASPVASAAAVASRNRALPRGIGRRRNAPARAISPAAIPTSPVTTWTSTKVGMATLPVDGPIVPQVSAGGRVQPPGATSAGGRRDPMIL